MGIGGCTVIAYLLEREAWLERPFSEGCGGLSINYKEPKHWNEST